MEDQGIEGHQIFNQWLHDEQAYLRTLAREPMEETLEMDYYESLTILRENKYVTFFFYSPTFN